MDPYISLDLLASLTTSIIKTTLSLVVCHIAALIEQIVNKFAKNFHLYMQRPSISNLIFIFDYDKNELKNHFSHGTLRTFHAIVNKMKLHI
jgi:superfamily II DNA or RNA helicase